MLALFLTAIFMPKQPLSVTIITLNEVENIARAIKSAQWADEVLVVDSGSTDGTVELARSLGARVVHHDWPGYGQQKNFAQSQATHDWILNIDGDEYVPEALGREIRSKLEEIGAGRAADRGFRIPRRNFFLGRWIRHGGWYPNYLVRLADRRHARWSEPHVHESLQVEGRVGTLAEALHNYSFPTIESQILTNLRFSRLGSEDLRRRGARPSLLKLAGKPVGKFVETFILKRGFLDGLPGLIISVNAAHSMFLKFAYLFEADMLSSKKPSP